jgi:tetratricopeptide (TPR) repeat protein
MQEEILTRLAKVADLKVISRTSTKQYQSKPGDLGEIAKQLGVANILEGSVQKIADQVRVNVRLTNAQTNSHLWADTFDRKLTDIFAVESEIAKRISESLQAKLTGNEEQALAVKPTNNPEAYDAYLRGLAFEARTAPYPSWEARDFFEWAVQLDPTFAIAWARLSRAETVLYMVHDETHGSQAIRAERAKRALENAQRLDPDSPETLLALGYYQYRVLRDYSAAKTTFSRVGKMLPGSSEAPYALGRVARLEARWDQSIPYFEQALTLDPRNLELVNAAALTYMALKQFPAALKLYDRALDIKPNDQDVLAYKACIYQAQGNLLEASKLLSGINETSPDLSFRTKISQLQYERNFGDLIRLLQARSAQSHYSSEKEKADNQINLAYNQILAGDRAGAKITAELARKTLEQTCRDKPDDSGCTVSLSKAYALIGEKNLALRLAERFMRDPGAKDAFSGLTFQETLLEVQMFAGEYNGAISTLAQLLHKPYSGPFYFPTGVTPALLRLDPTWDPLRGDPAFQKLCADKQP